MILREAVAAAPKPIPLVSHRYIPSEPRETGNPDFSIMQSDVICYGANLADYFEREFGDGRKPMGGPIRFVQFWSDFVERTYKDPWYPARKKIGLPSGLR
jgi:hypothetical protein